MNSGVYIHVPFCLGKCPYCDFFSVNGSQQDYDRYTEALIRAVLQSPFSMKADTLYFGGGTPSILGSDRLIAVKEACEQKFLLPKSEITVEVNPCSADNQMLRELVSAGFNRISVGVQALDDRLLFMLGRKHTAAQAVATILAAKEAGFEHISADLMLAIPGQTIKDIHSAVDAIAALPVDHLSAYLLKREPNTEFFLRHEDPDDDFCADAYLALVKDCSNNGFSQYEVSNFSKGPLAKSYHNLKYWRCVPTFGIGPAAHSFIEGRRFYFPKELDLFCQSENPWELAVDDGLGGNLEERLMLGLRLSEGIFLGDYPGLSKKLEGRWASLLKANLITLSGEHLALTPQGFLVSNALIASFLA